MIKQLKANSFYNDRIQLKLGNYQGLVYKTNEIPHQRMKILYNDLFYHLLSIYLLHTFWADRQKDSECDLIKIIYIPFKSLNLSCLELKLAHPIVTVLNLEIDSFPCSLNYTLYWKGPGLNLSYLLSIKSIIFSYLQVL
jgi:hypothetical protein